MEGGFLKGIPRAAGERASGRKTPGEHRRLSCRTGSWAVRTLEGSKPLKSEVLFSAACSLAFRPWLSSPSGFGCFWLVRLGRTPPEAGFRPDFPRKPGFGLTSPLTGLRRVELRPRRRGLAPAGSFGRSLGVFRLSCRLSACRMLAPGRRRPSFGVHVGRSRADDEVREVGVRACPHTARSAQVFFGFGLSLVRSSPASSAGACFQVLRFTVGPPGGWIR